MMPWKAQDDQTSTHCCQMHNNHPGNMGKFSLHLNEHSVQTHVFECGRSNLPQFFIISYKSHTENLCQSTYQFAYHVHHPCANLAPPHM